VPSAAAQRAQLRDQACLLQRVAALDCAINWVASGLNHGKKALVIAADFSRKHFHKDHEFVLGGSAAAILVSDTPKVVEYEANLRGSWTHDEYDTFRPTAREEMGNNEVSSTATRTPSRAAYNHYLAQLGREAVDDDYFNWHDYHMPFPGMALLGHRTVCKINGLRKKSEIEANFERKVLPSLTYAKRVGSTYGGSNFVGLCGTIMNAPVNAGDRIGFFARFRLHGRVLQWARLSGGESHRGGDGDRRHAGRPAGGLGRGIREDRKPARHDHRSPRFCPRFFRR
jgi:hydroxymethylglutaryl-CoA synthase